MLRHRTTLTALKLCRPKERRYSLKICRPEERRDSRLRTAVTDSGSTIAGLASIALKSGIAQELPRCSGRPHGRRAGGLRRPRSGAWEARSSRQPVAYFVKDTLKDSTIAQRQSWNVVSNQKDVETSEEYSVNDVYGCLQDLSFLEFASL